MAAVGVFSREVRECCHCVQGGEARARGELVDWQNNGLVLKNGMVINIDIAHCYVCACVL